MSEKSTKKNSKIIYIYIYILMFMGHPLLALKLFKPK